MLHGMDKTVSIKKQRHIRYSDIDNELWCRWLRLHMTVDTENGDAVSMNGRRVTGSDTRILYRWLNENSCASFWRADEWCIAYSLSINAFLEWVDALPKKNKKKRCPWASGVEPRFQKPLTEKDWAEIEAAWPLPADELAHAA